MMDFKLVERERKLRTMAIWGNIEKLGYFKRGGNSTLGYKKVKGTREVNLTVPRSKPLNIPCAPILLHFYEWETNQGMWLHFNIYNETQLQTFWDIMLVRWAPLDQILSTLNRRHLEKISLDGHWTKTITHGVQGMTQCVVHY